MVWAAISQGYHSPLVVTDGNLKAQWYRDDILAHRVIPLFHNKANISYFQHDNATSHIATDTANFRHNPPANINKLHPSLIQEWNNIPQAEISTLVNSMCRRCTAVVNSRGGHTRF